MEEYDIPEGFEVESIPEGVQAPLEAPVETPSTDYDIPEGFQVEEVPQAQVPTAAPQAPVWEQENVVPREAPPVDPMSQVPMGDAPQGQVQPPTIPEQTLVEPSVPDEGQANAEVPAELPLPSDEMYQGLSYDQANQVYDAYRRHPGVQKSSNGAMSYKGRVVYSPDMTFGDLFDPNIPLGEKITKGGTMTPLDPLFPDRVGAIQRAGHAVTGAVVDTAKTGIAVGDTIRDKTVGPEGLDVAPRAGGLEAFEKVNPIPERNTQSASGQFFDSAVEMATGVGLGGGVVKETLKKQLMPAFVKDVVQNGARGAGAVAALDENTDTLTAGPQAMLPIFEGFNIDPNDPRAEEYLAKKGNVLIDALATGAAGQAAAIPAKYIAEVFKSTIARPLIKLTSTQMIKNDETDQIVKILADLPPDASREQVDAAGKQIQQIVRGNKTLDIKINEPGIDDINMRRDPLSAIQRGGDEAMADRAGALKSTALRSENTSLEAAQRAPESTLKGLTDQMQTALGGDEAIERTRAGVVRSGQEEIGAARQTVDDISENIQKAEIDVANLVKNDPGLGKKLSEVSGETDFNPSRFKNESTDKIVDKLKTTYEKMASEKDAKFAKIGSSINMADPESFNANLATVRDSLSPQTLKAIDDAGGKFGPMFNQVRQMIRKDADGAYAKGDFNQRDAIMKLHDNIYNDQVEALVKSGGPKKSAEGQAAIDAIDYYKNEFAPIWNQKPLSDLASKYRNTIKRNMNENEFKQAGSDIVQGNISNDRRFMADNIRTALGDDQELVTDYIIGDAASNIASKVRTGTKLSDLEVQDIVGPLTKYGDSLPDGPGKQRIQTFVENFAKHKNDIKGMQTDLDAAAQNASRIEKDVMETKLKDFFSKQGTGEFAEQTDGYQALTSILRDPKRSGDLPKLVERIDATGDPLLKRGLQVAYARYVDEALQGGAGGFNKAKGKAIEGGWDNLLENGKVVFADKPNLQIALERVVEEATLASKGSLSKVKLAPGSQMVKEGTQGANSIITAVFGVLNKTAARVRILTNSAIRKADRTRTREDIFEALVSDADYLDEAIEDLVNKPKAQVDAGVKRIARRIGIRAGIRAEADEELSEDMNDSAKKEDTTPEQTEKAFSK